MGNVESGRHTLARLIDAVADARGLSDEDIARRARSRGHQLSKSNISRIRNEPVKTINASVMQALSDGLGLPVTAVLQAALKAMGLPAGEVSNSFEDCVRGDPGLIPEARDHLLKQYALLLRVDQSSTLSHPEMADAELDAAQDAVIDAELDSDPVPPTPIRGVKPKRK